MKLPIFEQSFVLIDAEGRLVDWDEGFTREWSNVAHLLRPGLLYADLMRAAANNPAGDAFLAATFGRTDLAQIVDNRIKAVGQEHTHDYRTPDGRVIHVERRLTASGGIKRMARDVTAEHVGKAKFEEARELLHGSDPEGVGAYIEVKRDPIGNYIFPPTSAALVKMLDLPDDFIGADPMAVFARMVVTPEEAARFGAVLEHSAQTLEHCSFDMCVRGGNGEIKWIRESLIPRREADGSILFKGIMRDITRERHAEDQVELFRSVVVRSSDSIIILESVSPDPDASKILYVNPRFIEVFGGTAADLIGHPVTALQRDELARAGAQLVNEARDRGDLRPVEFEAINSAGTKIWVEARVETVQRRDDGSFRWVIISRDITERQRAQAELLHAKESAEAANSAKGQFLANMSHELRTPLNAIIGFSELIEQEVGRKGWLPGYTEYLRDISASGRHLLSLINTILDLSKIDAGMLDLDLGAVEVNDLVAASVTLISGMAREAGVELIVHQSPGKPEIAGDFLKLKQVLLNVLSNAVKFTPEGGQVTIGATIEDDSIRIVVTDTGCGMSATDLTRVVAPFVQVENSLARKYPGTGLGLSIAKQLCELHHGELRIASIEGQGTTVEIVLPLLIGRLAAAVGAMRTRKTATG